MVVLVGLFGAFGLTFNVILNREGDHGLHGAVGSQHAALTGARRAVEAFLRCSPQ